MKKIKWYLNTGFAGCKHEGEFEIEDDAKEEAFNCIEWGWEEKKDE